MSATKWPTGVSVGHTTHDQSIEGPPERFVILSCPWKKLTRAEARLVAEELLLRADFQDRTPDTRLVNEIPRRVEKPT